jgi:hypothetical protein
MIRKRPQKTIVLFSAVLPLALLTLLLTVKIHQRVGTLFEVHPLQKWVLTKGTEGQIISSVMDYRSAIAQNVTVVQFERGESMDLQFAPSLLLKPAVALAETVALVRSSRLQEQITALQGNLLVARATLASKSAGDKQPLIEEARKKVEYSEAKVQEKKVLFDRTEALFKKGYASQAEFDAQQCNLRQATLESEINRAQLNVYLTGSKEEELEVLRSTIRAYENELALLTQRQRDHIILAPVSGEMVRHVSRDTLFMVNNTSSLVLFAPVRYEKSHYLHEGQEVEIALNNFHETLRGTVVAIGKEAELMNGIQVLHTRIIIDAPDSPVVPGLTIGGDIMLQKVSLLKYLYAMFEG